MRGNYHEALMVPPQALFSLIYLDLTLQVDGKRLCIDGGSAGGYTTLAALAFKYDHLS
jgi:dipeptidyl aminopeptidase/acylaminoacyl peptidase